MMEGWPELSRYARAVEVPGVATRLFLYDTGENSEPLGRATELPVILVHGLGDEADTWHHLIPLLARERRVVAPDLPGFGRSIPTGKVSMTTHVAAIRALLHETGKAILVGNSLGAAIAELVAFEERDLVAGLVLVDGCLPAGISPTSAIIAALVPGVTERAYRAWRKDHEGAFRSLEPYYADLYRLAPRDRDFLERRVVDRVESESQCRAYGSSFRSYLRSALFSAHTHAIAIARSRIPLLLVWGAQDRIIPPAARETILRLRPDAVDAIVDDSGHLPHQERADETLEILARFFRSVAPR